MPKIAQGTIREWKGRGYARYQEGRGWVYYLRKMIDGKPWHLSTGVVEDEDLANFHFKNFLVSPKDYDPARVSRMAAAAPALLLAGRAVLREPLVLDDALAIEFLNYKAAPKNKGGRGNLPRTLKQDRSRMNWWVGKLHGEDLRHLTLERLNALCPLGSKMGGVPQKRNAIRTFINWLHRTGKLTRLEGPEMEYFEVPQTSSLRREGQSATEIIERENKGKDAARIYKVVRLALPPHWREHLDLLAATGIHPSDMERWVIDGAPLEPPDKDSGDAAILPYVGKDRLLHRAALSEGGLDAARAVKEYNERRAGQRVHVYDHKTRTMTVRVRSGFAYDTFIRTVRRATKKLLKQGKVSKEDVRALKNFGAGKMRHAVATTAAEAQQKMARPGVDLLEGIREQIGHSPGSPVTRKHYIDPSAITDRPGDNVKVPKPVKAKKVATLI